jgi:glycine cleavage system H protein
MARRWAQPTPETLFFLVSFNFSAESCMSQPVDRRYAASHEWVRTLEDGTLEVGITHFAQEALGDLVYVELPEVGRSYAAEQPIAVVESVKAASDVYAPVAGTVLAVNTDLADKPESINQDAFGTWMFRMQAREPQAVASLLDAAAYQAQIDSEH